MFRTEQLRYCSPEPAEPNFRLTKSLRCLTTHGKVPACTAERMGPRGVIRVWQRGRPAEVPVFCSAAGGQAESQRPRAATGKGRLPAVTRRRVWPSSVKTPRENIGYPAGLRKDPETCRRPTELVAIGRYPAAVPAERRNDHDHYFKFARGYVRRGQTGGPVAVETLFIWVVRLPWYAGLPDLPDNLNQARHRLMAVERRLKRHRQLNTAYTSAIRQYLENGGSNRHPNISCRNGLGIFFTTR
ncbi:hypothetical protein T03_4526 [Trichinella britovi]|uniref:Uncharacterized protein n=1 Tax=Trichinella britovi TaxID=45882 RepID=A0A0V1DH68_TRIBR|nr:hypothetical protein T09_5692 [Trichinella sp. T9]KRY60664.1 hypothetical protein T03_4526 [Trichinella britovi]